MQFSTITLHAIKCTYKAMDLRYHNNVSDKIFFKFDANDISKNPILKNHDKNK